MKGPGQNVSQGVLERIWVISESIREIYINLSNTLLIRQ